MNAMKRIFFYIALAFFAGGCGLGWHPGVLWDMVFGPGENPKNPDVYHIGAHEWSADTILVHIYKTSDSSEHVSLPRMTAECRSCNMPVNPEELSIDSADVAHIFLPQAAQSISARIRMQGKGIDTTFIQTERSPEAAMAFYHLPKPLVGRVMIEHFALLYLDTTQDSVVATANVGDELNIYGSRSAFYEVEHPNFAEPLYLLKFDAFRTK